MRMSKKFKIGQTVKVVDPDGMFDGLEGTVSEVDPDGAWIDSPNGRLWFELGELQVADHA
jgi:transcription antitermination factor NusG